MYTSGPEMPPALWKSVLVGCFEICPRKMTFRGIHFRSLYADTLVHFKDWHFCETVSCLEVSLRGTVW